MRIILSLLVFVFLIHWSNAQSDSMAIHFRSMSLIQSSIIHSLDLDKVTLPSNSLFSKSAFDSNLPKYKTTAFFCVLENQIQNTSKIPIRMRLGSLDYTNSMEGKNPFDIELRRDLNSPK